MSVKIKMRYDTLANWTSADPTLLPGEFAVARNSDGSVNVRVGIDNGTLWSASPQISGAGTPIEGFDFTDLQPGEVLFWDGTNWYGRGLDQLINGGNRISVNRNSDGTIDIAYFEVLFNLANPTWNAPNFNFNTTEEVGTAYPSFSVAVSNVQSAGGTSSNVNLCSGTINSSSSKVTNWANTNLTVSNNIGSATVSGLSIATGNYNWFNPNDTSITFSTTGTSKFTGNVTDCANGVSTLSDTESTSKQFAWRFWGFTSESSLSLSEVDSFVNDLSKNALVDGGLITNPNTKRNVDWNFSIATVDTNSTSVADRFLYFAVSTKSGDNLNYSWEPVFYPPGVSLPDNQFEKIGRIQLTSGNNLYYTIYRTNVKQISSSASFDID